jgi:hypothetical protein
LPICASNSPENGKQDLTENDIMVKTCEIVNTLAHTHFFLETALMIPISATMGGVYQFLLKTYECIPRSCMNRLVQTYGRSLECGVQSTHQVDDNFFTLRQKANSLTSQSSHPP